MVVFGQSCGILTKAVVIGRKWLQSGKSGCIRAKVVLFGQNCYIWAKVVVVGKNGCIRAKQVVF